MIAFSANTRFAAAASDDAVTTGSVGKGFAGGLLTVAAFALAILALIQKANNELKKETACGGRK